MRLINFLILERRNNVPYIPENERHQIVTMGNYKGPGQLNYLITQLLVEYQSCKGLSYQTINDILGALEGAKLEFYRRVAVPYENTKLSENGDVY